MRQQDVVFGSDLTTARVDRAGRYGKGDGTDRTRSGKVGLGVVCEPGLNELGRVGGTEDADGALEHLGEFVNIVLVLFRGRRSDRLCHDLCTAEEDSAVAPLGTHVL